MYNFFRWYPRGKIIFMAPTKPLVAQQIQACYEIMGIPLDSTAEMTGAMNPTERKKQWREKRVFYLTPQVLTNDISRDACPAGEVKCLVLDEAHKALGNYAYVQVVQELTRHGAVFRILALSATPGSDMRAIQQVVTNLRISKIELRNEDSPDILPYVHNRNIEKVIVPLGPEIAQVRDRFYVIFNACARRLMSYNILLSKDISSLTKFMVIQSRDKFRQNPPDNFPRQMCGVVEGDFALTITLTHALELLLQHGIRGFYNFLAGKTDAGEGEAPGHNRTRTELLKVNGFSQLMEDLRSKFGDESKIGTHISHPKLTKLREIILEHFQRAQGEGTETRVMIFSQYRDSVYEIVALLEEHAPLIKAMSFVGHGGGAAGGSAGGKKKGFTQADQIRVIKQFTEGNYNTLVSTCVGEEGLDIGDVDMIICYDMHKSPVRLVQRCGRTGRKRDGRIVMLMTQGKEEHVFNQSMLQKKSLLKNIVSSTKLKEFLATQEPCLIPKHLSPRCHEMPMQVTTAFPVPTSRPARSSIQPGNNAPAARKSKTTKCYYLSDAEMDYWSRSLQTSELVPVVPDSKGLGGRYDVIDDKLPLNLDKWLPWQSTLQPYHRVGHSTLTKNYVDIVEHIQSQQEEWYSNYRTTKGDVQELGKVAGDNAGRGRAESPFPELSFVEHNASAFFPDNVEDKSYGDAELSLTVSRTGLYNPDFLDLFDSGIGRIDSPNIPSPPPFCFDVTPDQSPELYSTSFHQPVARKRDSSPTAIWQPSFTPPKRLSPDQRDKKNASLTNTPISAKTTTTATANRAVPKPSFNSLLANAVSSQDSGHFDIDMNMNEMATPRTPPKSEAENSTFFLEASPILSQRPKRSAAKRSLERAITPPAEIPAKRHKSDAATVEPIFQVERRIATVNSRTENEPSKFNLSVVQSKKKSVSPIPEDESSWITVTQLVQDMEQEGYEPPPAARWKKLDDVQPNFELEVDFLESSSSLEAFPKAQPETRNTVTPVKQVTVKAQMPESPVFDFRESTASPSPVQSDKSKCSKSLNGTPKITDCTKPSSPVKAEFSLDFPDNWDDDDDIVAPSPLPASVKAPRQTKLQPTKLEATKFQPIKTEMSKPESSSVAQQHPPSKASGVIDVKSVWDDGFELTLSDIEDIEVVENSNSDRQPEMKKESAVASTANGNGQAKRDSTSVSYPVLAVTDTSGIRRELEDIFGPEDEDDNLACSVEIVEAKEAAKGPTPPVFTIDSDEEITPPRLAAGRKPAQLLTSDEDSPLICRKKLNSKRNPLMTQSTPIAQRWEADEKPAAKKATARSLAPAKPGKPARKASCSFLEEEAELSSVEGSCSSDEKEDSENADQYETSFVDDLATQAVNDTMRAVYLESVKSPIVRPQGFIMRQPSRPMNHDEIFSQAVVEQDSNYELDSFCVESDGEHFEESTYHEPLATQYPVRTRAARANLMAIEKKKQIVTPPVNRGRKRIVYADSSSEEEKETDARSPPKKSIKSDAPPTAAQSTTRRASSASAAGSSRIPVKKQEVKKDPFLRPAAVASFVPATDRAPSCTIQSKSKYFGTKDSSDASNNSSTSDGTVVIGSSSSNSTNTRSSNTFSRSHRDAADSSSTTKSSPISTSDSVLGRANTASCDANSPTSGNNSGNVTSATASSSNRSGFTSDFSSSAATLSPSRTMLISSRQVATTTRVISTLKVRHRCETHVRSFDVADFVVSPQLGVIRKLHSEFTNGSSRCRLQDQVRRLMLMYDKSYLIVEADATSSRDARIVNDALSVAAPDASSIIFKPNSPYYLQTLAALAQTDLRVLHSESQEHTASLLNDLARQETLKGLALPSAENLNTKQEDILKFLQRIPEINPAVALLMATQFRSLRQILCSSAETLVLRCKITIEKARNIVHAFRVNHAPAK